MPSYEPTPRRFSVLSVPQSAPDSRRNSLDVPTRPSVTHSNNNHADAGAAVELERILSLVQHLDTKDEERGRSRKGVDVNFGAPVVRRRESSASTRERIALWEERSRSQERDEGGPGESKARGRSKSRLRDLAAGDRVSVVPEVPELAAAFQRFEGVKKGEGQDVYRKVNPERATPRPRDIGYEEHDSTEVQIATEMKSKPAITRQLPRPQTPSGGKLVPLTPDVTPKERLESLSATPKRRDSSPTLAMVDCGFPPLPGSSMWTATAPSPPPTPVSNSTSTALHMADAKGEQDSERQGPSDILSKNSVQTYPLELIDGDSKSAGNQLAPRNLDMGLERRHGDQVWRISTYRPDFPVSTRHLQRDQIQSPGRTPFDGNSLQKLTRSQASDAATATLQARATGEGYPYSTSSEQDSRDCVVNIPVPITPYPPVDRRPGQTGRRNGSRPGPKHGSSKHHEWDAPPVIERAFHAASVSMIKGLELPVELYRGFRDVYYPAPDGPDIIKAYPIRRRLPVRIFFPARYDLTSPALLPTLFTIHGGGFTVGSPSEDDVWNRGFADSYTILIIALNYSKAPWAPFPGPLLDVEALYHAVLNDESLPIDRIRTSIAGFDAGANLALGLSQLPSVKTGRDPNVHHRPHPYFSHPPRSNPPPAAVISVCGILDFTAPVSQKLRTRPYKKELRGPRGWGQGLDWMGKLLPSSAWSYIPYGHDAADPLLSPFYAARRDLPPHVFVISAELDCLAHESWKAVSVWSGRPVPDRDEVVGRAERSLWRGCLEDADNSRFSWTEKMEMEDGVRGSTRWLLVPDVVHGFDSANWRNKYLWGDEEARMDAEMKTMAYQRELAEWLWGVVWK